MDDESLFEMAGYVKKDFHCPNCNIHSQHIWFNVFLRIQHKAGTSYELEPAVNIARCTHCKEYSIWYNGNIVFPKSSPQIKPNDDLRDDIKQDFLEAASIVNCTVG